MSHIVSIDTCRNCANRVDVIIGRGLSGLIKCRPFEPEKTYYQNTFDSVVYPDPCVICPKPLARQEGIHPGLVQPDGPVIILNQDN